jgi:DNA-binding GntR family transcriptional regulator
LIIKTGKRADPAPHRYAQLADILIEDIASGRYPVGDGLPTEHELCRQYELSRYTVRAALRRLIELGVVSRRQGSGTKVVARHPVHRYVQSLSSLDDIVQHAREARLSVRETGIVPADAELASKLGCKTGKRWLRIEGFRSVEGQSEPISYTEIYINSRYRGIRGLIDNASRAISALIQEKYDEPIVAMNQEITAIAASGKIAKTLHLDPGAPALSIVRRYHDDAGEIVILSVSIHPADRFVYAMSINKQGSSFVATG